MPPASSECRGCRRQIFWRVHTKTGRRAPLDAERRPSDPPGNIVLVGSDGYRLVAADESPNLRRYTNHFATCTAPPRRGGTS